MNAYNALNLPYKLHNLISNHSICQSYELCFFKSNHSTLYEHTVMIRYTHRLCTAVSSVTATGTTPPGNVWGTREPAVATQEVAVVETSTEEEHEADLTREFC